MTRKYKIFVAIIMAMIMIITSTVIYIPVIAEEKSTPSSHFVSYEGDSHLMTSDGKVISVAQNSEIVELREENVKHFALENGKYQAVVYAEAVHRKDERGVWQDIDNRLHINNKNGISVYGTDDGRISFVNALNYMTLQSYDFSSSFQSLSDMSQSYLMSLVENGYSVSLSLLSNNGFESVAEVSNHELRGALYSTSQHIDNKTSLKYPNVWKNVDLEYSLVSNDIKENIIVKAPSTEYSYSFILTLDGLAPELNAAGVIMLKDEITKEVVYYMPAPYMYDAEDKVSYDVHYSIAEIKNGNYLLNVTASREWMNDNERVFPVIIDPTIKTTSLVYDTYICSSVPNANYGFDEDILVSSMQTAFISINMPTLPTNAEILHAGLCVHYYIVGSGEYANLSVKRVLQPWTEGNLTYNTFSNNMISSQLSSQLTVHKANGLSDSELGIASIDLTETAINWYEGTPNYGVAISYSSGNAYPVVLKSYESGSVRPYYMITYSTTNYGVIPNVVNLNVYYDNAYLGRYSGAVSRIKTQMEALQELYYNEFDILINYSYPQKYNSYADANCSTSPYSVCSHATNNECENSEFYVTPQGELSRIEFHTLHHNNIFNMLASVNVPDSASALQVVYTGHEMCEIDYYNSHIQTDKLGGTLRCIFTAMIMNFNGSAEETLTFIHEFGHLYHVEDHYGQGYKTTDDMINETGDDRFDSYCMYGEAIMGNDRDSVVSNLVICDGCKAVIMENRNLYDHK